MKTSLLRLFLSWAALLPAVTFAQTYTNLYGFSHAVGSPATNADGALPYSGLVLSGNVLFGTTLGGGTNGQGGVFAVRTDGTHFTNLYSFKAITNNTNTDGASPYDTLVFSSNMLFGTASEGGTFGLGTVFRLNADGTGFTNLHNFSDGMGTPRAGLIQSGNVLYGTTYVGGTTSRGSVFRINTDGTAFTNLHSFTAAANDADNPIGGLVLSGNTLFGTTIGSPVGAGVIFSVGTDGNNYTNLFNFQVVSGQGIFSTNKTGGTPSASLLLLGNTLYGTAAHGGTNGNGVLFSIATNGTGFTNLHTFGPGANNPASIYTNKDGVLPLGPLLLSGSTLYGTASGGGTSGFGTVFSLNPNGSGFSTVYTFTNIPGPGSVNLGGIAPADGLLLANNTLYGTTTQGGGFNGNIFGLSLSPAIVLAIRTNGPGSVVLTWSDPTFSLQSATNVLGTYTNIPGATSPYTNLLSGPKQFFRLHGN